MLLAPKFAVTELAPFNVTLEPLADVAVNPPLFTTFPPITR